MAVSLPPISKSKHRLSFGVSHECFSVRKKLNKKELELQERRLELRSLQRELTKAETAHFRNSFRHNLCLDMLKEGFHMSFKELFALIHRQMREREEAGPESTLWNQVMLDNEHDKLEALRLYLTNAEMAFRRGDFVSVYKARFELACYFQRTSDKWLSDHFYNTCLETAMLITNDGGKTKAEGQCNLGLALEENGEFQGAGEHFEEYYKLSLMHPEWQKTLEGRGKISLLRDACIHLQRIYSTMGDLHHKEGRLVEAMEFHSLALDKAKESNDQKLEGQASYKLGVVYEIQGEFNTALLHLNHFYDTSKYADDKEAMGRACNAIARTYARMGCKEQSIEYLKEFVELAYSIGNDSELSKACHNLGDIYNSLGQYKEAGEYFNRAYNISRAMGDSETIQMNRVQSGIAQAHAMLCMYNAVVVQASNSRDYLERTMDWKSVRADIFKSRADRTKMASGLETSMSESTSKEQVTEEHAPQAEEAPTADSSSDLQDSGDVN